MWTGPEFKHKYISFMASRGPAAVPTLPTLYESLN